MNIMSKRKKRSANESLSNDPPLDTEKAGQSKKKKGIGVINLQSKRYGNVVFSELSIGTFQETVIDMFG